MVCIRWFVRRVSPLKRPMTSIMTSRQASLKTRCTLSTFGATFHDVSFPAIMWPCASQAAQGRYVLFDLNDARNQVGLM